ncbi:DUF6221 family protein [Streptomyces sp. NBC_01268]|uniref:DUF6221 family protein n=1 Tax=Streptomyces sp. NBC_01268 TaxID=2903806 RepID=UPI002E2FF0DF|nr:DUF6221 family protein [Streptomyces sp. NBC_01268]
MDLVEFLRARLDEDEAIIRDGVEAGESNISLLDLVDIDAKRRIVAYLVGELEDSGGDNPWWYDDKLTPVLRLLALPYADHPDYDEAWRP